VFQISWCHEKPCQNSLIPDPGIWMLDVLEFTNRKIHKGQHPVSSIKHLYADSKQLKLTSKMNKSYVMQRWGKHTRFIDERE
jgi:hypothetical protein